MSFIGMLNHTCDIYHLIHNSESPGYGLPTETVYDYPKIADDACVPCHFSTQGGGFTVIQSEPQTVLEAKIKLVLPSGTDVRINDKIVDCASGYRYTAEVPRDIHGHHIAVMLHRSAQQEAI